MLKHLTKKGYWAASMDVGAMPNDKDGYHVCEIHPADQYGTAAKRAYVQLINSEINPEFILPKDF